MTSTEYLKKHLKIETERTLTINLNVLVLYLIVQRLRGMINELQQQKIIFYPYLLPNFHSKCWDNTLVSFLNSHSHSWFETPSKPDQSRSQTLSSLDAAVK